MQVKREAETQFYGIQKIWGTGNFAGRVVVGSGGGGGSQFFIIFVGVCLGLAFLWVSFGIAAKWAWNIAKFG